MISKLIPGAVFNEILPSVEAGYKVGTRYYHTFDHALDVLGNVERVHADVGVGSPVEMAVAALYHDIHYVVGDPLNEDKSALKAMIDLGPLGYCVDPSRVAFLVWLTKYHFKLDPGMLDGDADAQIFLDCDIFGFAAPWKMFKAQNDKLDKEFSAGTDRKTYLTGRTAFLRNILQRGVFNSDFFKDKFENQARSNIVAEIGNLEEELRAL